MKISQKNIAGLECLEVLSSKPKTAVVFFHGYGANMNDLFPLWEMWNQHDYNWYFPNGVQSLPMGYYEGRAWFGIDVEALERAMRSGTPRDMAGTIPPQFKDNLKVIEGLIRELATKYENIIIGGFSQGAMCASHLAMIKDLPLIGMVLLSGNLLAESLMPQVSRGIPFYQSHGTKDPVLPLSGAKLLEEKLQQLNFQGKLHVFNGGHEIPMSVINEVKDFLNHLNE
jgi:phospholipase/carboxylesterase